MKPKIEQNIANYIKSKGINLSAISRGAGIPYGALHDSLFGKNRKRELRSNELCELCKFLEVDPMGFMDEKEQ